MKTYFIQAKDGIGPIKIGQSEKPERRLKQIQSAHPETVLAIIGVCDIEESVVHSYFNYLRITGEWFRPNDHLLAYIANPYPLDLPKQLGGIIRSEESRLLRHIMEMIELLDDDRRYLIREFAERLMMEQLREEELRGENE
jgi:hypothetical protein